MQKQRKFGPIATLAMLSLMSTIALPPSAQAQTLLDFLRGNKAKSQSTAQTVQQPVLIDAATGQPSTTVRDVDPEPIKKISGPQYYTYKAEAARAVDVKAFGPEFASVRLSATPLIAKALEEHYSADNRLVWITDGQVNDKAKAVLAFFEAAGSSGLNPSDYIINAPSLDVTGSISDVPAAPVKAADAKVLEEEQSALPETTSAATPAVEPAMLNFELALSARVLAYVQDVNRGRIDPNKISGYHDFKRKSVNLKPVLKLARLSPDVGALLKSREPSSDDYLALKQKLATLQAADKAEDRISLPSDLLIKPGQSNAALGDVLRAISLTLSAEVKAQHKDALELPIEGNVYRPDHVELVKAFQAENGLKPDGVIGRASARVLVGDSNAEKIEKVVAALERLRWLPADFGQRFVFINQPAYMAYYHEGGAEQFGMRVVVGSKANQTNFFMDEIETVEVNPYWGVPQSIIYNEMLPKLRKDPNYLDRSGYQVQIAGKTVASYNVDWNSSVKNISVRQPPGSDNALGELKILFPNAHAIYMHDTPSKSYFNRDNRALSHGCIRLVDPRKMAAAVLGTSVQKVGEQIASGQNRAIQVPKKVPVYVAYFTAWPNKDGKVEYFDDVYGRDGYLKKAFDATSKAREKTI